MPYLLFLIIGLSLVYIGAPYFFQIFSKEKFSGKASLLSLCIIIFWIVAVNFLSTRIEDVQLANRVLHSLGGGVSIVLISFLAIKDYKIKLGLKEGVVLIFLAATALGVANEIVEFFLQSTTKLIFSNTSTDTWLDLVSNFFGTIVGLVIFTLLKLKD